MPSNPAKGVTGARKAPRLIVFVVFPEVKLLDLAGPLQVFADAAHAQGGVPAYRTIVAAHPGGPVPSDTSVEIPAVPLARVTHKAIDTLLVAGGRGARAAARDPGTLRGVTRLSRRARRTGSICTGAFVLAAAGLLAGRRAVTHWDSCAALAAADPRIRVESDPIFVKDGSVWTSAGVTAGIDLALAMVAEDLGREAALGVARSLVSYMVRPGGQSQFSAALDRQASDPAGRFDALHGWILENLDRDLRVEALAARLNMSPRSFARHYAAQTGQTPARAVEALRVEAARRLLEDSGLTIAAIAGRCGFHDDEGLRRAFGRVLHVSPSDYRQRFRG